MLRAIRMYILEKAGRITPLEAEIDRIERRYAAKERRIRKGFHRAISGWFVSNAERDFRFVLAQYDMLRLQDEKRKELEQVNQAH